VRRRELERPDAVSVSFERRRHAHSDAGIEGGLRGEDPPGLDRSRVIARPFRGLGEPFQRPPIGAGEPLALAFHPSFELRGVAEEEAVEERPSVQRQRCGVIATRDGAIEVPGVDADQAGIQTDPVGRRRYRIRSQRGAHHVDGLFEQVPCVAGVALGPEIGNHLVPVDPGLGREPEQRQKAEAVALRGSTGEYPVARPQNAGSAEESEPERESRLVRHGAVSGGLQLPS
jgi:hypothetical protein